MHQQLEYRSEILKDATKLEEDAPLKGHADSKKPTEVVLAFDEKHAKRTDTVTGGENKIGSSDNGLPSGVFGQKGVDTSSLPKSAFDEKKTQPEESITDTAMASSTGVAEEDGKKREPVEHKELFPVEHEDLSPVKVGTEDTELENEALIEEQKYMNTVDDDALYRDEKDVTEDELTEEHFTKPACFPFPHKAISTFQKVQTNASQALLQTLEAISSEAARTPCENADDSGLSTEKSVATENADTDTVTENTGTETDAVTTEKVDTQTDAATENADTETDTVTVNADTETEKASEHTDTETEKASENTDTETEHTDTETEKASENAETQTDKATENVDTEIEKATENVDTEIEKATENASQTQCDKEAATEGKTPQDLSNEGWRVSNESEHSATTTGNLLSASQKELMSTSTKPDCSRNKATANEKLMSESQQLPESQQSIHVQKSEATLLSASSFSWSEEITMMRGDEHSYSKDVRVNPYQVPLADDQHSAFVAANEPTFPAASRNLGQNEPKVPSAAQRHARCWPNFPVAAYTSGQTEPEAEQTFGRHDPDVPVAAKARGQNEPKANSPTLALGNIPAQTFGHDCPQDPSVQTEQTNIGTHGQNEPGFLVATSQRTSIPAQSAGQEYTKRAGFPVGTLDESETEVPLLENGNIPTQAFDQAYSEASVATEASVYAWSKACVPEHKNNRAPATGRHKLKSPIALSENGNGPALIPVQNDQDPSLAVPERENPPAQARTKPVQTPEQTVAIPQHGGTGASQGTGGGGDTWSQTQHAGLGQAGHITVPTFPEVMASPLGASESPHPGKTTHVASLSRQKESLFSPRSRQPQKQDDGGGTHHSTQDGSSPEPDAQAEVSPVFREANENSGGAEISHPLNEKYSSQNTDIRPEVHPSSTQPREHHEASSAAASEHQRSQTPSTEERRTQDGVRLRQPYQAIRQGCLVLGAPPVAMSPSVYARDLGAVVDLRENSVHLHNTRDAHRQRGPGRRIRGAVDLHILERTQQGGREYVHYPSTEDNLWRVVLACFRSTTLPPEEGELCVCNERRPDTVLFNCLQHLVCLECATYSDVCPVCWAPIRAYMQIY